MIKLFFFNIFLNIHLAVRTLRYNKISITHFCYTTNTTYSNLLFDHLLLSKGAKHFEDYIKKNI